tara:strand:+ start:459 stop:830 length:372 start_codon:yes stop_codon:yes gene_type:complete
MKTIVENSTKLSKFLYEDDKEILMEEERITIGPVSNPDLYVGCHSKHDCTLYENIEGPSEAWAGNKYMFDGTTWTANPDWKDPAVVQAELDAEREAKLAEIEAAKKAAEEAKSSEESSEESSE